MLGTKCPSITSRWIQAAPAASTARTSSPSLEKSDARIDGAMTRGREANCWGMCAYPETFEAYGTVFRVTRATPGGNAGGKFCRCGINCRGYGPSRTDETPYFIGFFTMARGLLIPW